MKKRLLVGLWIIAFLFLSKGTARAFSSAECPPVFPNYGITSTVQAPMSGNPLACDFGFSVDTTAVLIQAPAARHYIKIQNTSASTGPNIGICFGQLEMGTTCTMATAGTVLMPGVPFYMGVAMYGGMPLFNSMFFTMSVEVIATSPGATVSVSID